MSSEGDGAAVPFHLRRRTFDEGDDDDQDLISEGNQNGPSGLSLRGLGLNDGANNNANATIDEEEHERFEPYGLKSRRREKKRFVEKAIRRSECFLCAYVGERNTVQTAEEVNVIVEMLRTNTGRMESAALAEQVAEYYKKYRARVNTNLQPGETPLPPMTERTVLEHIRRHNQDPEIKKIVILEELQEMREALVDVVLERSNRSKQVRANKIQVDCLEKIVKLEWAVQAKDPSKMVGYAPGARTTGGVGEPGTVVATQGKTLYNYWGVRK